MKDSRRAEELKDARAYRQSLIHKRNELDAKIAATEERIKHLNEGK